ncbi:hypothetical protein HELRODRAFT_175410 [Helobdella robusta]|uniref:Uncharacterized protein n=1 Tax=Helobdella robusta TaxID=6412 RepID=T1F988_HELRO|nr:hypothetical protein HELRODRAFT_175410 [Helobdella robusta]ESO00916.1 hypothetical protein HELRODRAFT_175410 [Helobdella robusta]
MKIRSGILPRLKQFNQVHSFRLKLPEEFIMEDPNGCDVTLRSFIQWQRMHAWLGLMRGGQWWESARFKWCSQDGGVGRISSLAVRLTFKSSDEILCADLNVVVGAMEYSNDDF